MEKKGEKVEYHLSKKQQCRIEALVPLHQMKIHMALRVYYKSKNEKNKRSGAVALSEHYLIIFKKNIFGSYRIVDKIHLFDIRGISTKRDDLFSIVTTITGYKIWSPVAMKLVRNLMRNYILATLMMPPNFRFEFQAHDASHFPPFRPSVSPSQQFQFAYNAYCSYYNATYYHEVVRFFHKQITSENGIFDLNLLPLRLLEFNLGNPVDLRAVFAALMFCQYTFGVCASDMCRPDILKAVASLLVSTPKMRLVSLSNCHIKTGASHIASAIAANKRFNVAYWDLSYNEIDDLYPFVRTFAKYPTPVFYLDLNYCGMNADIVNMLLQALNTNPNFKELKYLHIAGSEITKSAAKLLRSYLKKLSEKNSLFLRSLDLGKIQSGQEIIFDAIARYSPPLESFKFVGTHFKKSSFQSLIDFIENSTFLSVLDISNTNLSIKEIGQIIDLVSRNSNLTQVSLYMNSLKLNSDRLESLLKILDKSNPYKFSLLSFEDNGMNKADFRKLLTSLKKQLNMRSLYIGRNFNHNMTGIGKYLVELLSINSIEQISLQGCQSRYIGNELLPFFEALKGNHTVRTLDVSFNKIGDKGIKELASLLRSETTLCEIQFDGSAPESIDSIIDLFDTLIENGSINCAKFPSNDVYNLLEEASLNDRMKVMDELSAKQLKFNDAIQQTQARFGLHPFLSSKNIPELDDMLDDVTLTVHKRLVTAHPHIHSGITRLLGLPLPYSKEDVPNEQINLSQISGHAEDEQIAKAYDSPELQTDIIEEVDDDLSGLETLQFNSLCIRRPGYTTLLVTSQFVAPPNYVKNNNPSPEKTEETNVEHSPDVKINKNTGIPAPKQCPETPTPNIFDMPIFANIGPRYNEHAQLSQFHSGSSNSTSYTVSSS